jgi:CRISPR-associated protein Csx14
MTEATIPVNLFNPGQVFACLGFVEAADILLGDAEGGFDWTKEADVRFRLRAKGEANPVAAVLDFVADAKVHPYAPHDYADASPRKKKESTSVTHDSVLGETLTVDCDTFPAASADTMTLPIRLCVQNHPSWIQISHWADGSTRNDFKLYAGNRSAVGIATEMLRSVAALWQQSREDVIAQPFDVLAPVRGSFNFDPRRAWTGIDAGYSPDKQSHALAASPVVEILTAIGLEHARPDEYDTRQVRYSAWGALLPPLLARPALSGARLGVSARTFRFTLDLSGKNKVVTFAQEERGA